MKKVKKESDDDFDKEEIMKVISCIQDQLVDKKVKPEHAVSAMGTIIVSLFIRFFDANDFDKFFEEVSFHYYSGNRDSNTDKKERK